jgi:hypothetical protein
MASAEPVVTLYQLQNNCENLADETFRRVSADDEDRVDYRAHYNARLNKCLYAETYISPTPVGINMWVYLSGLGEDRIYGGFHRSTNVGLFYCNLEDKECHVPTILALGRSPGHAASDRLRSVSAVRSRVVCVTSLAPCTMLCPSSWFDLRAAEPAD